MIAKGTWVRIHRVVLKPEERSSNLPEATRNVPLEMWIKGRLCHDANINDIVQITTRTGRIEEGTLVEANPTFNHDYGDFVDEIIQIDDMVHHALFGDNYD